MAQNIYQFLKKYKHIITIIYFPLYMVWFLWLENRENTTYHAIHCHIDDLIPFNELFIIPYMLWFLYVATVLVVLFFQTSHLRDFYRCTATLMLGMTTCLIIYTIWPSVQHLRPEVFPRQNFFSDLVARLYQSDTPTNVCPSIHVYNSIAVHTEITNSYFFKKRTKLRAASFVLCCLICMSTLFLKQHSFIDVIAAIVLYIFYYTLIYRPVFGYRSEQKKKKSNK